jgi:hypothetical protein
MKGVLIITLVLNILALAIAQDSATTKLAAPAKASATAASVSSYFASMATGSVNQPGDGGSPGDPSSTGGVGSGNEAGASGSDYESFSLSKGGLIAIIVVIVAVVVFGGMLPD